VIRVAFICDSFEMGGQEMGCLELMRRLDRSRFTPYLYTFRPGGLLREAAGEGIPTMVGHHKPGLDQTWTTADRTARTRYRERLSAQLRTDRIDVCLLYAWVDGIEAAREAGIHAIVERVDGVSLTSRLPDKSACRRIICESKAVRDVILAQRELLRCRREQIAVIPNGIDLKRFDPAQFDRNRCRAALGLDADHFVIGTVARLAPEKNLDHLLRATALLIGDHHQRDAAKIRTIIIGPDAGSRKHLEALAQELGIAANVNFPGPTRRVPEALSALDVFAIASFYEGAPFSLLEAMAMGLPIVATPVGAIPEIIDGNGFLVCVLHPEETARALGQLQWDIDLRRRLGRRSRRLALRHDVGAMVRKYQSVLVEALDEKQVALTDAPSSRATVSAKQRLRSGLRINRRKPRSTIDHNV
jgi:glycosyltransferase involved in cell wall biosynthesis